MAVFCIIYILKCNYVYVTIRLNREVLDMEKTTTLNLRVNPIVKQSAESVLSKLGISMSAAINMYLNQISLTGGIPFAVTLPKAPASINTAMMTDEEIHAKLQKGYADAEAGNVTNAAEVFEKFRENH